MITIDEISDEKDSYSTSCEIESNFLVSKIGDFENSIKKMIDESNPHNKLIEDLTKLGFK